MGKIAIVVDFAGELPPMQEVIKRLKQLVVEKIVCESLVDDNGFFGVLLSSEAIGGSVGLLPMTDRVGYEAHAGMSSGNSYLMDALAVILLELGGNYEYASSLPAAVGQPWKLARKWYRKHCG